MESLAGRQTEASARCFNLHQNGEPSWSPDRVSLSSGMESLAGRQTEAMESLAGRQTEAILKRPHQLLQSKPLDQSINLFLTLHPKAFSQIGLTLLLTHLLLLTYTMCIYANVVDNERSNRYKEGPSPASFAWKNSTGDDRKMLENDTAVVFSIDAMDMDFYLEEEVMDWTVEEDSSDYMDWTAVQFDEAIEMEWVQVHFGGEMEYCVIDETMSDDIDSVDQENWMVMDWEVEFQVRGEAMDCD
jgi:hypothetical protein